MKQIILLAAALSVLALGLACGNRVNTGGDTPTEGYKRLYAAVKSKDTEAIKSHLTKKTIEFGAMSAQKFNKPLAAAYENGFTGTTFSDTLPNIRDERVNENMAALEVWNSRDSRWEDLPFMFEDGSWKLAVGDLFAGTYKSPGKSRTEIEQEAANAAGTGPTPVFIRPTGNAPTFAPPPPPSPTPEDKKPK